MKKIIIVSIILLICSAGLCPAGEVAENTFFSDEIEGLKVIAPENWRVLDIEYTDNNGNEMPVCILKRIEPLSGNDLEAKLEIFDASVSFEKYIEDYVDSSKNPILQVSNQQNISIGNKDAYAIQGVSFLGDSEINTKCYIIKGENHFYILRIFNTGDSSSDKEVEQIIDSIEFK